MRRIPYVILIAVLAGCNDESRVTEPAAEGLALSSQKEPAYRVDILRTSLGGTFSRGSGIANGGIVAGFSFLPGDDALHAALWRGGEITDLGTLGGPSSRVPWPGVNNRGMAAGISQTGELDPLNEDWSCEGGGFLPPTNPRQICSAFVWMDGAMQELPTLGGNHGFATGMNSKGQVVGWAETPVHGPTCTGVQVLQFKAVMWEPRKGTKHVLRPLPGDSTSAANDVNENGQAVGISGDCDQAVGRFSALHGVLWDHGVPQEIPNLGGDTWHTPQSINERGDVVGFSNPPGPGDPEGEFIAHAFLWINGSPTAIDLGTLPGDAFSQGQALNSRGQVVGVSIGDDLRAFLWEDGVMMDLNELAGPGFGPGEPHQLLSARDINDRGQITGEVREQGTGLTFTYIATPAGKR